MHFQFIMDVEVERTSGKFATRDEIEAAITEELDGALTMVSIEGENGGQYEVTDWSITENPSNPKGNT